MNCARPKNKLSKDYRRFPTLLIDDNILIDPAEDIFEFESTFMLQGLTRDAKDIFITHSHIDSFSPLAIERLCRGGRVRIYASETILAELEMVENAELIVLRPFSLVHAGKYAILPLPANHRTDDPTETPFNFLIECEGKTVFYGLDGAWLNPLAWQVLEEVKLDAAVLDCALANEQYSGKCAEHNNLEMAVTIRDIFISAGVANEHTKFFLSHIPSSKKRSYHEELTEAVADLPFKIAYDGYFVGI